MSRFNLIDEKWIPVRMPDGTRDEFGIRDTLLRSKEIAAIEDPSPLVVASLHRFLLAVLYRALEGPTDIEQAKALFRGGLPGDKIVAYLEKWRPKFLLFDEKYPFGQIPSFVPKTWREWTALAAEHNADNAKVLFDHVSLAKAGNISPGTAARWLLATQSFAVSAGKSEIAHTGTAPSAGSVMAIPIASNLMDTLIFCLVPQNKEVMHSDIPLWEKEPETLEYLKKSVKAPDKKTGNEKNRAIERVANGIVDLYTWRTRSILFKQSLSDGISKVGLASGIGYKQSIEIDPMLGYNIKKISDKDSKEKMKIRVPIQFGEKGFWRDFDSLLPDNEHLAPKVIENVATLSRIDRARMPKGVMVLGQRYNPPRPNIVFWRQEHFALPEALSGDKYIRSDIRRLLIDAEDAGKALWNGEDGLRACLNSSMGIYAKNILARGGREVPFPDIKCFAQSVNAITWYWAILESHFHEILSEFKLREDSDDVRRQWMEYIRATLHNAWDQHCATVSAGDIWAIRAVVLAEGPVKHKLQELKEEILKYESKEEGV
ncbi:MAG: type I-E CRISPR-associated protein Cse1/CasA [Desulfobacteraceae bacterium]|nr:type I-E CRISPR-associated protein Cse1/CasA [Desulfobacteraceae bacterium]